MQSHSFARLVRALLVSAFIATLIPVILTNAAPGDYVSPIFGISTAPDDSLLVADFGQGIIQVTNGTPSLVTALLGVTDVAASADGSLWAITSGDPGNQLLYRVEGGTATPVANLFQFEAKRNPHMASIDSNTFDVADLGGQEALVADAGGNDLLTINKHGKVKLVAVLPDELVSTENLKNLVGCPTPPTDFAFVCGLPPLLPAQPVATSVAIGPDGAYYVGELKGFPAPTGASKVWRIESNAHNAKCGKSPMCSVALEGFTSIIDLAFGPDGRLYVAQIDDSSWAAVEFGLGGAGGSVHACNLATKTCETVVSGQPILTSITFRNDGSLWGAINALIPGVADVVQLVP